MFCSYNDDKENTPMSKKQMFSQKLGRQIWSEKAKKNTHQLERMGLVSVSDLGSRKFTLDKFKYLIKE